MSPPDADVPFGPRALRRVVDLLESGDAAAALALARTTLVSGHATALLPDFCHLAGVAADALGDAAEAESMWRHAIEADPHHAAAWLRLGALLAAQDHFADAADCLQHGLALEPEHGAEWDRLGQVLMRLMRPAEAEACHRRAIDCTPADAAPHTHLGFALEAQARDAEALGAHRVALALEPAHPSIHTNLGNVLARLGDVAEAEARHRRAIALAPDFATAHCNLGVLLAEQRRDAEAEAALRTALRLRPGHPHARLDLGFLRLAQGRFAEGWALHEARHDPALPGHGIAPPPWPVRPWHGEPLAGRSVLVWAEQGFGDQIQFCRYAPLLKAHGAGRVTLVCQRPLLGLFETLHGIDRLVAADVVDNAFTTGAVDLSDHDVWTFPLTLPLHLKTDAATVPAAIPYLHAVGETALPGAGTLRVGLVWRGNPRHHNDADRSLPGLATLAPLWSVPDVTFIGLQTGAAAAEPAPVDQPLHRFVPGDFADTARVLAGLDLLVSVDTSAAHLAGALGVPCWVLLPEHRTDWRWLRDRDDSPWYPRTMRLFRQTRRGDWAGVVERVRRALRETAVAKHWKGS